MSIDLETSELQRSIAATIDDFCRDRCTPAVLTRAGESFPRELWTELADLGVLDISGLGEETGVADVCIASEALGRGSFPGPVAATYMAAELLEGEARDALTSGRSLVSFSDGELAPWAPVAGLFLLHIQGAIWACSIEGEIETVMTLAGEPWGRVDLVRENMLSPAGRPLALFNVAHAAYIAAAARRLLESAAEHARTRRQFGKVLGDFQAVAHPLADCAMKLDAAAALARAAACSIDATGASATLIAAAARRSADNAAKRAAVVCHQVFGAIGITIEGPAFQASRRLEQAAAVPPRSRMFDPRLVESISQPGVSHDT